jgi:hypothetical protein
MITYDMYRQTALGLVVEAIGAAPEHRAVLESFFHTGVGRALTVGVAAVPPDEREQIATQADQFWAFAQAIGVTPMPMPGRDLGFADQCGDAALWHALTDAQLTADAWVAVMRGANAGPSPSTRDRACTTALTALCYADRVDQWATPQTRVAACQDAVCALAYLRLLDTDRRFHAEEVQQRPAGADRGQLPTLHRLRAPAALPLPVLDAARRAGYPRALAVLCFTLRVLETPIPAYQELADVRLVRRHGVVIATTDLEAGDQVVAATDVAEDDAALALIAYHALRLQTLLAATQFGAIVDEQPRSVRHDDRTRRAA